MAESENRGDDRTSLYDAVKNEVDNTLFSRTRFDPDELINEVFLRLLDGHLPPLEPEEFFQTLRQTIRHTLRDMKRFSRPALDIDEVAHEEHPLYDMNQWADDLEFETTFERFCESFDEPTRTVYARSRILTREDIAELTNLTRRTVSKMIRAMPREFERFLKKSQK